MRVSDAPVVPTVSVIPVRVSVNKSPGPPGPLTPSCRPIEKPATPTEPSPDTVTVVVPPETESVCAVTLAGPPANDQSVTVDGL